MIRPEWNCPECNGEPIGPFECVCVTRQKVEAQMKEAAGADVSEWSSRPGAAYLYAGHERRKA